MALTKDFISTVKARADRDVVFRVELLKEAIECLLEGDIQTGKTVLRDYINATVGFESLAQKVSTPPKSLHRMLSPKGNPRAENLFKVLVALQRAEHVEPDVRLRNTGHHRARKASHARAHA